MFSSTSRVSGKILAFISGSLGNRCKNALFQMTAVATFLSFRSTGAAGAAAVRQAETAQAGEPHDAALLGTHARRRSFPSFLSTCSGAMAARQSRPFGQARFMHSRQR